MNNIAYNIKRFAPAAFVLALGIYFVIPHIQFARMTTEEKLRHTVAEISEAIKSRNANGILDYVSENYSDAFHSEFNDLRRGVSYFCLYYRRVDSDIKILEITQDEDDEKLWNVDVKVKVLAGKDAGRMPGENILKRFTKNAPLRLIFQEKDLLIISIERTEE